ncbi:putative quinol monooxygenase [Gemmobacter serpentinus]|uniref:putative quinol monooxygenase n=1 Tax=Gemmobacter serpentinus TaxID=2652247 RepID=UPI001865824F|nr:putative quinol monooxygenase [Gemmobacter serpentinus]
MSDLVYVFAHVQARPGHEDRLRDALLKLVTVTEAEPGFLRYDLHQDCANPGHFAFYEIWQDQASLDIHAVTDAMRAHQALTADWIESVTVQTFRKLNG